MGIFNTKQFVWFILYAPLLAQTWRYQLELVFYGEYLHWTGLQSTQLILLALAVTPLRRFLPNQAWVKWLLLHRRAIGVASFIYALLHVIAYLVYKGTLQSVVQEGLTPGLLTGWVAFVIFLLLAVTSNDYSLRLLLRRWKTLHKAIYMGAALTLAHWILTAFNPTTAYVYLGVGVLLIALRPIKKLRG